jgi:hypothetical protein
VRAIVGWVTLASSLVVVVLGFVRLIEALESGGYGTSAMWGAFGIFALSGALLSVGIALLIWEYSIRYGIRH